MKINLKTIDFASRFIKNTLKYNQHTIPTIVGSTEEMQSSALKLSPTHYIDTSKK